MRHAIEVGHVFKLGTKYSEALGARFLDHNEQLRPIIMGCYGIGMNRIIAGLIETSHDDNGIIWPVALAPYEVLLVPMKVSDAGHDGGGRRSSTTSYRRGHRRPDGRPRRPRRGEVQGRRPGGRPAPRGDRRPRSEGGQDGDQVALGEKAEMIDRDDAVERIAEMIREKRKSGKRFANRTARRLIRLGAFAVQLPRGMNVGTAEAVRFAGAPDGQITISGQGVTS